MKIFVLVNILSSAPPSASSPSSPRIHRFRHRHLFLRSIVHQQSIQVEAFRKQPGPHRGASHRKRCIRDGILAAPGVPTEIRVGQRDQKRNTIDHTQEKKEQQE